MKGDQPNALQHSILACIAAMDPAAVEMMGIFERMRRHGETDDLLVFALALADLEEHGYICRAVSTQECIALALGDKGRKYIESRLPKGVSLAELQKQVQSALEDITGMKARRVC